MLDARLPERVRHTKLDASIHGPVTVYTRPLGRRGASRYQEWKLERWIGKGGDGIVSLQSWDKGDGTPELRAVKQVQLYADLASDDHNSRRYVRELEALAIFAQDNFTDFFVRSYGWYIHQSWLYISMEYCEHLDLGTYLKEKKTMPEDHIQDVAFQVLTGLQLMHNDNIAHRDIKPGNILIKCKPPQDWWVKLGDLGLSRRSGDASGSTTVRGTPKFMAPELESHLSGFPVLSEASNSDMCADMWSLGETIAFTITGQPTFRDQYQLMQYQRGLIRFPDEGLRIMKLSEQGIHFVRSLMDRNPNLRLTALKALEHPWMKQVPGATSQPTAYTGMSSYNGTPNMIPGQFSGMDQVTQASGLWTQTVPLHPQHTQVSASWTETVALPTNRMGNTWEQERGRLLQQTQGLNLNKPPQLGQFGGTNPFNPPLQTRRPSQAPQDLRPNAAPRHMSSPRPHPVSNSNLAVPQMQGPQSPHYPGYGIVNSPYYSSPYYASYVAQFGSSNPNQFGNNNPVPHRTNGLDNIGRAIMSSQAPPTPSAYASLHSEFVRPPQRSKAIVIKTPTGETVEPTSAPNPHLEVDPKASSIDPQPDGNLKPPNMEATSGSSKEEKEARFLNRFEERLRQIEVENKAKEATSTSNLPSGLARSKRIEKKILDLPGNPGESISGKANKTELSEPQKKALAEERLAKSRAEKLVKLDDFKKFSRNFKLQTPIPTDLVEILAKDEEKQQKIVEQALRNAEAVNGTPQKKDKRPTATRPTPVTPATRAWTKGTPPSQPKRTALQAAATSGKNISLPQPTILRRTDTSPPVRDAEKERLENEENEETERRFQSLQATDTSPPPFIETFYDFERINSETEAENFQRQEDEEFERMWAEMEEEDFRRTEDEKHYAAERKRQAEANKTDPAEKNKPDVKAFKPPIRVNLPQARTSQQASPLPAVQSKPRANGNSVKKPYDKEFPALESRVLDSPEPSEWRVVGNAKKKNRKGKARVA